MSKRVNFEITFEVGDDVPREVIESIVADAFVQIDEAVHRPEEDAWAELPVHTTILEYATTIDGEVIESWEREP